MHLSCFFKPWSWDFQLKLVARVGQKEEEDKVMMPGTVDLTVVLSVLLINYK